MVLTLNTPQTKSCFGMTTNKNQLESFPLRILLWLSSYVKTSKRSVNFRVIVVLEKKVYVYNFSNLSLIDSIDTTVNQLGLITISYDSEECVLACPDKEKGKV